MSKRTFSILLILLLIVAAVVWANWHKTGTTEVSANTPILSVAAFNQSRNVNASTVEAKSQDVIVYTLTAENSSDKVIPAYVMEVDISGVSDKATLVDAQGASYNSATNSLVWTPLDIPAGTQIQKQFSVRVNPVANGTTNTIMTVKFNNQLSLTLVPPVVSGASTSGSNSYQAPTTGPAENIVFGLAFLATLAFALTRYLRLKRI